MLLEEKTYNPGYNPEFVRRAMERRREMEIKRQIEARKRRIIDRYMARLQITEKSSIRRIITIVAEEYGLTYGDIIGHRRTRRYVQARFEAIAEVKRQKPHLTLPQLGKAFNRDHTSILHALQKMGVETRGTRGTHGEKKAQGGPKKAAEHNAAPR